MQKIEKLEEQIGYKFKNKELLIKALTHPSYSNEDSCERLEFLGDIILDAIVGIYLFKKYKDKNESFLTDLKSAYVNRNFLHKIGTSLNLKKYIRFKGSKILYFDRFVESLIGAIYIDGGWRKVEKFVKNFILKIPLEPLKDYKTILYRFSIQISNSPPVYQIVKEKGPQHNKTYEVKVKIKGKRYVGRGKGRTKREAEMNAAKDILQKFNISTSCK